MPESTGSDLKKQLWDLALKVAFLAIPLLLGWVIKLEVGNALQDERIAAQDKEITELKAEIAAAETVDDDIGAILVSLARLDTTTKETDKKVGKLYDILLER